MIIARIDEVQLRSLDLGFRNVGIELRPQTSVSLNLRLVQVILALLQRFFVNPYQSFRLQQREISLRDFEDQIKLGELLIGSRGSGLKLAFRNKSMPAAEVDKKLGEHHTSHVVIAGVRSLRNII